MLSKCFYSKKNHKNFKNTLQKESFVSKIFFKKSKWDPQFWPKVFKFSKNGHFAPKIAKIAKSPKLSKFFMSILKGLKWFSEKNSREQKVLFYHSFSIF